MKLTVTVDGLAGLARLDPERLLARLRPVIDRELRAAAQRHLRGEATKRIARE